MKKKIAAGDLRDIEKALARCDEWMRGRNIAAPAPARFIVHADGNNWMAIFPIVHWPGYSETDFRLVSLNGELRQGASGYDIAVFNKQNPRRRFYRWTPLWGWWRDHS